jgi:hypothetical protein
MNFIKNVIHGKHDGKIIVSFLIAISLVFITTWIYAVATNKL